MLQYLRSNLTRNQLSEIDSPGASANRGADSRCDENDLHNNNIIIGIPTTYP